MLMQPDPFRDLEKLFSRTGRSQATSKPTRTTASSPCGSRCTGA